MPSTVSRNRKRPASDQQGVAMLVFESLSAGGIAVFLALVTMLVLVGIYSYFVWPFTHWGLAQLQLADDTGWEYALAIIFAAGSAAGFWCFSGAAFRKKPGAGRNP
jgi:hypothetical protein